MIRSIMVDTKQGICSLRFITACIVLLLLMSSATGVLGGYDIPTCTIFHMLLTTDEQLWLQSVDYSSYEVWVRGINANHMGAFLPAVVSFPLVPLFCDELKSQNYRFHCIRSTYTRYCLSKCFSAMLTSCCVVLMSMLLFGIICYSILPPLSAYENNIEVILLGRDTSMPWTELIQRVFFLLGFAISDATLCLLLASFTLDKFSSICLPVVVFFLGNQLANKLYVRNHDVRYYILGPDYQYQPFEWLPALFPHLPIWIVLLIPTILCILCMYLILAMSKRRMRQ